MQKVEEVCTARTLRIANYVCYALMALGLILRFITSAPEDAGIGGTPAFLYIVQFLITAIFIMFLLFGEFHKPTSILLCFPLLMSRVGRGTIIMMLSMPLTNFLDAWTSMIAIICAFIGFVNIYLGWKDGPVELKYAEEGMPERGSIPAATAQPAGQSAPPAQEMYQMAGRTSTAPGQYPPAPPAASPPPMQQQPPPQQQYAP